MSTQHKESPFKGERGFRRLWNACHYTLAGFRSAYRNEEAFRQEVWLALVLIPLAFYLSVTPVERCLMLFSVLLVLIVELLNSAIEAAVDRVSLEQHRLSKRAKDIGSAAVFAALVNLALIWLIVLL